MALEMKLIIGLGILLVLHVLVTCLALNARAREYKSLLRRLESHKDDRDGHEVMTLHNRVATLQNRNYLLCQYLGIALREGERIPDQYIRVVPKVAPEIK